MTINRDERKEQQRKAFRQIHEWNEQIVLARKQGQHDQVLYLKQRIETFLQQQIQETSSPAIPEPTEPIEPTAPLAVSAPTSSFATKQAKMQQLHELNLQIVAARRQGNDGQVRALQSQATDLMAELMK